MKKMLVVIAVLAMCSAAMALSVPSDNNPVNVNINVLPTVEMWANNTTINLVLDGKPGSGGANADAVASGISHINNVPATITVAVDGTLPVPAVANGGGINFFIYPNQASPVAATTAMILNAYNPAGSLAWTQATLGTTETFGAAPAGPSIQGIPCVYAANAPGEMPEVNSWALTVTYTITAD